MLFVIGKRLLVGITGRSEEHTSELQSLRHLVFRLLLEKKKNQDPIERMNAVHAVVRESGKTIVITEEFDPVLQRLSFTRSSLADIRNYYMNATDQVEHG